MLTCDSKTTLEELDRKISKMSSVRPGLSHLQYMLLHQWPTQDYNVHKPRQFKT